MSDDRSRVAVQAWQARDGHDRLKVIEAATGYPPELVAEVESVFYSEDERDWTTPRSEVLGGRAAKHVVQRARAFAAELLLPREVAGQVFSDYEDDEARAARSLRARFGMSSELLAWQAKNSVCPPRWLVFF